MNDDQNYQRGPFSGTKTPTDNSERKNNLSALLERPK